MGMSAGAGARVLLFQLCAHRRDMIAGLVDRIFQVAGAAAELLAPVLHFERIHQVDAARIQGPELAGHIAHACLRFVSGSDTVLAL
ncbi:hypothetical protein CBM2608_B140470 [Cupriavidus taiwanensis]|nr:hypothetical protein CBM2608_B140470 [Cupriavidus taiwanensis]